MPHVKRLMACAAILVASGSCGSRDDSIPGREGICTDDLDDDGDGHVDCDDQDCDSDPACATPAEICDNDADDDGDGHVDCDDQDCDSDPACATPAEICDNDADDDGDGDVDCDDLDCELDPACVPPAEDCDNGLDDDGDGERDCFDSGCAADAYCAPADFVTGADFFLGGTSSVTIALASDYRNREARMTHVTMDGQRFSLEPAVFLDMTLSEAWSLGFGVPAGVHRFTLDLEGAPVWDFGDVAFAPGLHQSLIAYGDLDDPRTMSFEQPAGLEPDEVVIRMINVWDTREPFDVVLCPPGDLDACTVAFEDLAYGEVWERTVMRTDETYLGCERTPPPGYSLPRYIDTFGPAGQAYCWSSGPHAFEPVLSTLLMMLPYQVSLDPGCLGCTSDFVFREPFPVDLMAIPGSCP